MPTIHIHLTSSNDLGDLITYVLEPYGDSTIHIDVDLITATHVATNHPESEAS